MLPVTQYLGFSHYLIHDENASSFDLFITIQIFNVLIIFIFVPSTGLSLLSAVQSNGVMEIGCVQIATIITMHLDPIVTGWCL